MRTQPRQRGPKSRRLAISNYFYGFKEHRSALIAIPIQDCTSSRLITDVLLPVTLVILALDCQTSNLSPRRRSVETLAVRMFCQTSSPHTTEIHLQCKPNIDICFASLALLKGSSSRTWEKLAHLPISPQPRASLNTVHPHRVLASLDY